MRGFRCGAWRPLYLRSKGGSNGYAKPTARANATTIARGNCDKNKSQRQAKTEAKYRDPSTRRCAPLLRITTKGEADLKNN